MRSLMLIAVLALAGSLAAESVEMEIVGHTATYSAAEPVGNVAFSVSPDLSWYSYEGINYTTVENKLAAGVTVTGGPSDAGGLFNIKVKCELPAEADRPKDSYGYQVQLYLQLMFKGGKYAGMDAFAFQPGKKIARIMYVEECATTGVALDTNGKAIANSDITLVTDKGTVLESFGGRTNDKGEFTVYAPYGASYDLRCGELVVASAYSSGWINNALYFTGGAYGAKDVGKVTFAAAGGLKFAVMDSMPEGSYVTIVGPDLASSKRKQIISKGKSFSGNLAAGKYSLEVSRADGWNFKTSTSEFEVKVGEVTDLGDLGALPGEKKLWIDLKLSKDGADASRAYVYLADEDGYSVSAKWNADALRWEFVLALSTARVITARVELEGFGAYSGKLEVAPEAESVEIKLEPLSYIRASAEDENGGSLWASMYAVAHDTEAHKALLQGFQQFRDWRDDNYYDWYKMGATELYGSYETKVAPGKYTVIALLSPISESLSKEVEVPAGETVSVVLSANAQEVKLTFTRNGEPVAEREVILLRPSDYDPWTSFGSARYTDAKGSITIGIRAGRFSAKLPEEDLWSATVLKEIESRAFEIKAETTELAIDLTPKFSSVVVVEVVPSDDTPIMSIEVTKLAEWRASRSPYSYDKVRPYTKGGAEFDGLEPGVYRAACYCSDWDFSRPAYIADFDVKGSGIQKVKLAPKRRVLKGQVKLEGGQPLPEGAELVWYYTSSELWLQTSILGGSIELDAQGNYEFADPPLLDLVLGGSAGEARGSRVVRAALVPSIADVNISPRLGDLVVRVKAPYQTDFEFSLVDAAGNEYAPAPSQVWQNLAADSAAVLADLPTGKFDLVIRAFGCLRHTVKDVQVQEGKTVLVETALTAAPNSRWRLQMPEGVELDNQGVRVEFLDDKGKVISEWAANALGSDKSVRLEPGWTSGELELSVFVADAAAKSIRVSATGCKPILIAVKDFPEEMYNEWGELQYLVFERN